MASSRAEAALDAVIGSGDESHAAGDAWKCWDVCGHARQNLLSETRSWIRGSQARTAPTITDPAWAHRVIISTRSVMGQDPSRR